jgi:hypothetical protein
MALMRLWPCPCVINRRAISIIGTWRAVSQHFQQVKTTGYLITTRMLSGLRSRRVRGTLSPTCCGGSRVGLLQHRSRSGPGQTRKFPEAPAIHPSLVREQPEREEGTRWDTIDSTLPPTHHHGGQAEQAAELSLIQPHLVPKLFDLRPDHLCHAPLLEQRRTTVCAAPDAVNDDAHEAVVAEAAGASVVRRSAGSPSMVVKIFRGPNGGDLHARGDGEVLAGQRLARLDHLAGDAGNRACSRPPI